MKFPIDGRLSRIVRQWKCSVCGKMRQLRFGEPVEPPMYTVCGDGRRMHYQKLVCVQCNEDD